VNTGHTGDIELWHQIMRDDHNALKSLFYKYFKSLAAIGLLMLAIVFQNRPSIDNLNQSVIVSAVQPQENELVILPDNSKVWLRSGSEISYDADFSPRDVVLKGEAFFDVTSDPDHPFVVRTAEAYVRVLGTRFNVKEMSTGDVELFVEEGRVSFGQEERPDAKVLVTRDQVAVFRISTLKIEAIDIIDVNRLSWKTKKLIFDNVELRDVLKDLERHYKINFEVTDPAMLDCDLKADFEDSSVEEVIETVEFIMGWEINQTSDCISSNESGRQNSTLR